MPTYTVVPEFPYEVQVRGTSQRAPREAGSVTSGAVVSRTIRRWGHGWNFANSTTVSSLDALWTSTRSGALSMDWTPPAPSGESAIKVRFRRYQKRQVSAVQWRVRVELEEAHGI